MRYRIRIVTKNDTLILNDLTEMDTVEALADAYDCIIKEKEYVTFKNFATVSALDLTEFYVE